MKKNFMESVVCMMKKNFMESVVCKTNPLYIKKNITYIVGKQYLDHEKDAFSDDIAVWVKSKTNHLTSESGKVNLKKFQFEFYEERTKIIRYIHYWKTSIDFHRVIIFFKKTQFYFYVVLLWQRRTQF